MIFEEYIKPSEACQCIMDYINGEEFTNAIVPEDRGAFISGLGMAGVIIMARCQKYLCKKDDEE